MIDRWRLQNRLRLVCPQNYRNMRVNEINKLRVLQAVDEREIILFAKLRTLNGAHPALINSLMGLRWHVGRHNRINLPPELFAPVGGRLNKHLATTITAI